MSLGVRACTWVEDCEFKCVRANKVCVSHYDTLIVFPMSAFSLLICSMMMVSSRCPREAPACAEPTCGGGSCRYVKVRKVGKI